MPFRDACNNTLFLRCDQVQHQTQQSVLSLAAQFHRSGCSLMALQYAEKHTKVHRYKRTKKSGNPTWNVSLHDLVKFIGLVVARKVIRGGNFSAVKSLWGKSWGISGVFTNDAKT